MSAAVLYERDRGDTDARWVSAASVPVADARAEVARLSALGRTASWAPDGDDPAVAWIYVDWSHERTRNPTAVVTFATFPESPRGQR